MFPHNVSLWLPNEAAVVTNNSKTAIGWTEGLLECHFKKFYELFFTVPFKLYVFNQLEKWKNKLVKFLKFHY